MNKGCTKVGICGKQPKTANLQDKLIYVTKLFAKVLKDARNNGTFIEEEYENQIIISIDCRSTYDECLQR